MNSSAISEAQIFYKMHNGKIVHIPSVSVVRLYCNLRVKGLLR